MSTEMFVFGIVIVSVFGIAILNRCNRILSRLRWLEECFMPKDSKDRGKRFDFADEWFSLKEKIAPLFFLPFAYNASELIQIDKSVIEEFERTRKDWEYCERRELESFATMNPPKGKAFTPSDTLKRFLRAWSIKRHQHNVINKWKELLTETYVDLLSGKITIKDAEKRVESIDIFRLRFIEDEYFHSPDPEVEGIFHSWASNWDADKWNGRLNHLCEMERLGGKSR